MTNFKAGRQEWEFNTVLLAEERGQGVIGYAKAAELPSLSALKSGQGCSLKLTGVMLDLTSFPSSALDGLLPDISYHPVTLLIRFGGRVELRLRNCLLTASECAIHPDSRFTFFDSAKLLLPGGPQRFEPWEVG